MAHSARAGWWVIAAAVLMSLGCRPGRPPVTGPDRAELPSAPDLLASLRRQASGRRNLRTLGRVTVFGPQGRARLKTVLVAERPRSFRFETLTPLEQPIDVMACDGERLWWLHEGELYEGPATSDNVARLLPLPMRPEEIVETLLGGVPVPERFEPLRVEVDGDRWRLELEGPLEEQGRLWIDPGTLRVLSAELSGPEGEVRTSVELTRFESPEDGGPAVPTEIEVRVPPRDLEVRIRFRDPETNVELPLGLFELRARPGVRPQPLPPR